MNSSSGQSLCVPSICKINFATFPFIFSTKCWAGPSQPFLLLLLLLSVESRRVPDRNPNPGPNLLQAGTLTTEKRYTTLATPHPLATPHRLGYASLLLLLSSVKKVSEGVCRDRQCTLPITHQQIHRVPLPTYIRQLITHSNY